MAKDDLKGSASPRVWRDLSVNRLIVVTLHGQTVGVRYGQARICPARLLGVPELTQKQELTRAKQPSPQTEASPHPPIPLFAQEAILGEARCQAIFETFLDSTVQWRTNHELV